MTIQNMPYLNNLALSNVILNKIEESFNVCEKLCPERIESIFISNYVNQTGKIEFDSLWFFSSSFTMEVLLTENRNDLISHKNSIYRIDLRRKNYNFEAPAIEDSRMVLEVNYSYSDLHGAVLKATGKNCDNLKDIYFKYIQPNFLR